jgi:hypothetical protein
MPRGRKALAAILCQLGPVKTVGAPSISTHKSQIVALEGEFGGFL